MEIKDRFAHLDVKQLEEIVSARIKQIKKIFQFAESVVREYGRVVENEVGSSNTRTVARLDNFEGFNFILDTGQTMMGGNSLSVEFNSKLVLSVYYQGNLDECRIDVSDISNYGQSRLEYVMSHKDEIVNEIRESGKAEKEQWRLAQEHFNKRARLLEAAERLKL